MRFYVGMMLVITLAICTFIELLSMWNLTRREVQLCNMLSPEAPRLSLATYNWGLVRVFIPLYWLDNNWVIVAKVVVMIDMELTFSFWLGRLQVFVAMLVDNFLYPISAFRSHFSQSINWSGIRYHLKDGKIFKVYHLSLNSFLVSFHLSWICYVHLDKCICKHDIRLRDERIWDQQRPI